VRRTSRGPTSTTTTGLGVPATAHLKFTVNIDKFVFFRLGTGAWPTPSGTIDGAAFTLLPTIPGGPTSPAAAANNAAANWNGGAPAFAVSPAGGVPFSVEVRSNGGQVSLRASVGTPLNSTTSANTIPMSEITVASSNSALPAPAIPNAGTGAPVSVTPTAFGTLVTQQTATWTFTQRSTSRLALRRLAVLLEVVLDQAHAIERRDARVGLEGLVGRHLQAVGARADLLARRAHEPVVVALRLARLRAPLTSAMPPIS
jgi:hypothetical protein